MVLTDTDLRMAAHYGDFLPEKIFDAHVHMYLAETIPNFYDPDGVFCLKVAAPEDYLQDMLPLLPGVKEVRLNMLPMPDWAQADPANGLRNAANEHLFKLYRNHPVNTVCPYVMPADTEEQITAMAQKPGVRGFKCYCYGMGTANTEQLAISRFLPESLWTVANALQLPIILHIMRPRALSDEDNFSYITKMAKKHPNAQLVLAHCARGFASWTAVEAIRRLEDLGNIWFDLSAICESGPMMACIMKNAGERTMWGSDYPICKHRGRAVSIGTGSHWLNTPEFSGLDRSFIAAENLMAFYQAALLLELDATQINRIFYGNANELFGKIP